MASTPKTTYNSSDNSMSGWIAFSVIGHVLLLLILSTIAPQVFTKKQTPLQQKQIATQKRLFDEQYTTQLQQKMQRMDEVYNELVEHRNRRVRQYQDLEEKMQTRLSAEVPQRTHDVEVLQHRIEESFTTAGLAFDSLQSLQRTIQNHIKAKNVEKAVPHLSLARQQLKQLNRDIEQLRTHLQESHERLDELRNLLTWFNNDTLLWHIDHIKSLQNQAENELLTSQLTLNRYRKSMDRQSPAIEKNLGNEKSGLKRWAAKQRLTALAKKNISAHDPHRAEEAQKEARKELLNIKRAQNTLRNELPRTPFAQRQQHSGSQQRDIAGLSQTAQQRHDETAQVYKEARAAELALIQNKSYSSAYHQLANEKSLFDDDRAYDFPDEVSTTQDFGDYKKAFDVAARDMDLILADIQAMRQKAVQTRTSVSDSGVTDVTLALRRETSTRERLTQLAGPRGQQVQDLSRDMFLMKHPNQSVSFSQNAAGTPPAIRLSMLHYGRKISSTGKPVQSFYIDSWYMIGPFPNSHRAHIDDVFPPETIIDLDAEYIGKNGPMRWEYCSSSTHFIKPIHFDEYAIYYAYTELYCENDMTVWMAFGSDDRLDFWINDIKVWQSGNNLKQWRPDEGFRQVYLEKGFNKMLARLENGYRECGFSVIVALQ